MVAGRPRASAQYAIPECTGSFQRLNKLREGFYSFHKVSIPTVLVKKETDKLITTAVFIRVLQESYI